MARDPEQLQRFADYAEEVPNHIAMPELEPYLEPDYDLNDEKEFQKYHFDIEKTVRGSFEYQHMVGFLRDYVNMNGCSFYENVSNAETTKIHIEIHHEPLSLYDITAAVVQKRIHFGESLEVEHVAKEIVYNHYAMNVGLIPLSETVHELVHNQYLFIPNNIVYGNWRRFVDQYGDFISDDVKLALQNIEDYTLSMENEDYKHILERHYIYYDADGFKIPKLDSVTRMMKDRLNEIMNGSAKDIVIDSPKEDEKHYYCPFSQVD